LTAVPAIALHEDCTLVERIQRGDTAAFQALYDKYLRLVYRYVHVRVGDPQEAEDLTAETFIKAWHGLEKYECRDKPVGAWLFRIAHNQIVDKYRKRSVLTDWLPFYIGAPERQFARIEQQDEIRRAFGTLNYEQQVILHMHFFEDYTVEEVARFLDKAPNAVRVAQFRALRRLRQFMQHDTA
jgi:RNA polymerase sigma-70 factor (ECF subfamily)